MANRARLLALAALLALTSCDSDPTGTPPSLDLTGEWDFALALPGDEGGTCSIVGALVLTQTGTSLAGTSTVYYRFCGATSSAEITAGTLSDASISFRAGACSYTGIVFGSPADSIAGDVACSYTSGTWTAARVGLSARLVLVPLDRALVVGGTQQYTATLEDADGHVLYGRTVDWTSNAPGVATVSATGLVTGVGPGSATITATAAGRSAVAAIAISAANFVALAPGAYHTCALTASGAAYCWGDNDGGQLGDSSQIRAYAPVPVRGGYAWASLSAGSGFTCGVTRSGTLYCWGSNAQGRLGNNDSTSSAWPRPVLTTRTFAAVNAGYVHACGLTTDGAAYCWGANDKGQLGNGSLLGSRVPVPVSGGLSFAHIAAGWAHTCGITTSGAAYCWGENGGKLGTGDTTGATTPVAVAGGMAYTAIGAGRLHTCALASTGAAYCWGAGVYGQLGTGSRANRLVPTSVAGGGTFATLSAAGSHAAALAADGQVWGWGSNGAGECGDSTRTEWDTPVAAAFGSLRFSTVRAGWNHTCGITTAGVAYCWGYNSHGQLGGPIAGDHTSSPVRVAGQP